MRYAELIRQKAAGSDGDVNVQRLAELTKLRGHRKPSYTRWHHNLNELDGPRDMPWGTTSYMRSAIDAESAIGAASVLGVTERDLWLSVGESIGLRGMFPTNDLDTAIVRLPRGWWTLDRDRFRAWAEAGERHIDDQAREQEIAVKDARIAELEARVAELEGTARPARRAARK